MNSGSGPPKRDDVSRLWRFVSKAIRRAPVFSLLSSLLVLLIVLWVISKVWDTSVQGDQFHPYLTVVVLPVGLVLLAALSYRHLSPVLSLVASAAAVLLFIVVWAEIYIEAGAADPRCIDPDFSTVTDAYYFTVTTLTTTGYGDIRPRTQSCRALVMTQQLEDFVLAGSVVVMVGDAIVTLVRHRDRGDG